jgi:hypothetical protein
MKTKFLFLLCHECAVDPSSSSPNTDQFEVILYQTFILRQFISSDGRRANHSHGTAYPSINILKAAACL